jgi:hypothetical protein
MTIIHLDAATPQQVNFSSILLFVKILFHKYFSTSRNAKGGTGKDRFLSRFNEGDRSAHNGIKVGHRRGFSLSACKNWVLVRMVQATGN